MIVVLTCAGDKSEGAGNMRQANGLPVSFLAHPEKMPSHIRKPNQDYARPYDTSDSGCSWTDELRDYNDKFKNSGFNPFTLLPAGELYRPRAYPDIYRKVVRKWGTERVYILSAGWGLVSCEFLLPNYDITFSASAKEWKRRRRRDPYQDMCHLPHGYKDRILLLGGKDYVPLFCQLTRSVECRKTVFYFNDLEQDTSKTPPHAHGYEFKPFHTTRNFKRTWHYECAIALIDGKIAV